MRRKFVQVVRVAITLFVLLCAVTAFKCGSKPDAAKPVAATTSDVSPAPPEGALATLRREFGKDFPIPAGEKHEYEIRYARFPLYATVGIITFEYAGQMSREQAGAKYGDLNVNFKPDPAERFHFFRASAISKGILVAIAGVDVKDRFETLIDERDFSARLSFKEIQEGKKRLTQTSVHDQAQQSIKYQVNDLTKPQSSPRVQMVERKEGTVDLLTSFYLVRLQKLKEGQILRFPVNDDEKVYDFDIIVGKREKLSTDCGKMKTIRLEPKIFGPGKFFNRAGEMTMWVSDDDKHVPLRLVAKTSAGTLTAKLLNFKKNCNIIEPDPESGKKKPAINK
jgi:hypothetical protein